MMDKNIPIIHFLYPVISEVLSIEGSSSILFKSSIEGFNKNYLFVRDQSHQLMSELRTIHVLYSDLIILGDIFVNKYNQLVNKYGSKLIDMIFIKDENIIKSNLLKSFNLAMDDIYKVDEMIIQFDLYREGFLKEEGEKYKQTSDITNILYSVLQENFIIIKSTLINRTISIHFKKKRR